MRLHAAFALLLAPTLLAQDRARIDNDQVRVLAVTSEPGKKGAMHKHDVNRVMIYLDAGRQTLTSPEGKVERSQWRAGAALWSPSGGLHASENVGKSPYRIIEVELKKPGAGAGTITPAGFDPLFTDPKRYKLEFENDQVRVIRARYGPREKGALHEHSLNRVVVFLTDMNMKVTPVGAPAQTAQAKAGEVRWGGEARHTEENLSDQVFEVVVVELKTK